MNVTQTTSLPTDSPTDLLCELLSKMSFLNETQLGCVLTLGCAWMRLHPPRTQDRRWDPFDYQTALQTLLSEVQDPEFLQVSVSFYEASLALCEKESLPFQSEHVLEERKLARENWLEVLARYRLHSKVVDTVSTRLASHSFRILTAVVVAQVEWLRDVEFLQLPLALQAQVLEESPMVTLSSLL